MAPSVYHCVYLYSWEQDCILMYFVIHLDHILIYSFILLKSFFLSLQVIQNFWCQKSHLPLHNMLILICSKRRIQSTWKKSSELNMALSNMLWLALWRDALSVWNLAFWARLCGAEGIIKSISWYYDSRSLSQMLHQFTMPNHSQSSVPWSLSCNAPVSQNPLCWFITKLKS